MHARHPLRQSARGLATLTVVMVLFFVMALVAAYANRNLLIEQRVATNSYRAERAMTAAEAGVDWAITLLNRGRVKMTCESSSELTDPTPRDRYLSRGPAGQFTRVVVTGKLLAPSCAMSNGQLACACPTAAVPDPVPHAVKTWPPGQPASAFRITLNNMPTSQPGVLMLEVQGCGSPGQGDDGCASSDPFKDLPDVDGFGTVRVYLGLVQALPQVPVAAVTAGLDVTAGDTLTVTNADNATGLTVRAGNGVAVTTPRYAGPAGSGDTGEMNGDPALRGLVPKTAQDRFKAADLMFQTTFGLDAPTYRRQPAVVRINCGVAGCSTADLETALARYPGLTYWFDGDLRLATAPAAAMGSTAYPVMAIVDGELAIGAGLDLTGFLYATRITWSGAASAATVRGALMAVETFDASVPATVTYDAEVMQNLRLYYGSFVRVPASWSRP